MPVRTHLFRKPHPPIVLQQNQPPSSQTVKDEKINGVGMDKK
jgi:hypothetical protein